MLIAAMSSSLAFSADLKVIEYRDNFLEIEVDSKDVFFNCDSDDDPEYVRHGTTDLMGIHVRTKDRWIIFFARRKLGKGYCEHSKMEVKKVLGSSKRVKIAGIDHFWSGEPHNVELSVPFGRIRSNKYCWSYFQHDCDAKNYWLGVRPGPKARSSSPLTERRARY